MHESLAVRSSAEIAANADVGVVHTPRGEIPARILIGVWAAVSVVLLTLASVYDQTISRQVADASLGWALWFQQFGEVPGYLAAFGGATIVLGSTDSKAAGGQAWAMAATAGLFLVLGFTSGGVVVQLLRLDKLLFGGIIGGVFCALATVVALLLGEHGRGDLRARLQPWRPLGLSLVLLAVLGGVTLTAIKEVWGRARPNMVLPSECAGSSSGDASCAHTWSPSSHCNDFDGHTTHHKYNCTFSGWWVPHGPRSGLTSFPSGHTFSGWLPLPIMFHWNELPLRCHSLGLTAAVWVILLLWGFTVAASRVFVGAHWCSDVLVSSISTWALAAYLWRRHAPVNNA